MTVLMTAWREYSLGTDRWEITWQNIGGAVPAELGIQVDGAEPVPVSDVPGLRPRPYAGPGVWLLDLQAVRADRLGMVVTAPDARRVALTLEGGPDVEALHHPGVEAVAAHRMRALAFQRGASGWVAVAETGYAGSGGDPEPDVQDAPARLQRAALAAQRGRLVSPGQPVVLLVDCSASMRPRFVDGSVAAVAAGAQSLAAAAGQRDVELVAVGGRRSVSGRLPVAVEAEEELRALVARTGLVTGVAGEPVDRPGAVVLSVADGPLPVQVTAAVHLPLVLGADAELSSGSGAAAVVTRELRPEDVVGHVGRASAVL